MPEARPRARRDLRGRVRGIVAAGSLLLLFSGAVLPPRTASATPQAGDTMSFRIVYGRPTFSNEAGVACYLWSEGGRLHVRLVATETRHRVRGELRTSRAGSIRDEPPTSEDLVDKQSKPSKLESETRTGAKEEGLDVTLAGDFNQLTIDLTVDDERKPDAVR